MEDLAMVINPDNIQAGFIPDRIQHYPIMNSKLSVLRGEESKRVFDYRVVITNPNAISEKENTRKEELNARLQQVIADKSQSEDEFNQELEKINDYFTFEWQDSREIRANALLSHYTKEYNIPFLFNMGFMDGMTVGEEIYQCDIVGGEPTIEKINPLKIRVFKSGYSNRIEDAGMIVIEDYWSPSRVIDTFYDSLSRKDIEYIGYTFKEEDNGDHQMNDYIATMEFLEDLKHHSESTQTKAKTSSSTSNTCSDNTINITCQTDVNASPSKFSNTKLQVIQLPLKKIKIDCSKKGNRTARNMVKNSSTHNYNFATNVNKIYSNKNTVRPLRLSPSPKKPNILELLNTQLNMKYGKNGNGLNKSVSGACIKTQRKSSKNLFTSTASNKHSTTNVHKVKINFK